MGLLTAEGNGASAVTGVPVLGTPADLHQVASRLKPDRLVLNRRGLNNEEMRQFVQTPRSLSLKDSLVPAALYPLGTSAESHEVAGVTMLGNKPPVLGRTSPFAQRPLDVR